jgi:hypothetical protein
MKIENKKAGIIVIIIIITYLLIKSCLFINVEGRYSLQSGGNCHFLSVNSDTLLLHADGSVTSRNFKGNATYVLNSSFFRKEIEITFSNDIESIRFPIICTMFGHYKFQVCMDRDTYYVKI